MYTIVDVGNKMCSKSHQKSNDVLEMVGNIWDNLTEMAEKEPDKYHEMIQQSKLHHQRMNSSPPVPHTCFRVKEKVS